MIKKVFLRFLIKHFTSTFGLNCDSHNKTMPKTFMIIQANPNEVEENSAGFTTDHEVTARVRQSRLGFS